MPACDYWETLLVADTILGRFQLGRDTADVVEVGCGFGTFTVPLARRIGGVVHAFDIDSEMTAITSDRVREAGLRNVRVLLRDVMEAGFGLREGSCAACLLFNILHCETPVALLQAARDVVVPGGVVAVIHWRDDIPTPRGPSAAIRPSAAQISAWAHEAGGLGIDGEPFLLPPWHFGVSLKREVQIGRSHQSEGQ